MTEVRDDSQDERLYGVPGAEELYDDIAAAYESQVEPWVDEHDRRPRIIEEWSVHPPEYHVTPASQIVEWLIERVMEDGEITEGCAEELEREYQRPELLAAAEGLRTAMAGRIRFRMAHRRLAEHTITWDGDEPLVDGERMYRPRPAVTASQADRQPDAPLSTDSAPSDGASRG